MNGKAKRAAEEAVGKARAAVWWHSKICKLLARAVSYSLRRLGSAKETPSIFWLPRSGKAGGLKKRNRNEGNRRWGKEEESTARRMELRDRATVSLQVGWSCGLDPPRLGGLVYAAHTFGNALAETVEFLENFLHSITLAGEILTLKT